MGSVERPTPGLQKGARCLIDLTRGKGDTRRMTYGTLRLHVVEERGWLIELDIDPGHHYGFTYEQIQLMAPQHIEGINELPAISETMLCPTCDGHEKIDGKKCKTCNGVGLVKDDGSQSLPLSTTTEEDPHA